MKINIPKLVIIYISLFLFYSLKAQEITAESKLSKDSMMIGEQISYSLSIKGRRAAEAIVPVDQKFFPPGLEVLDQNTVSENENEIPALMYEFTLTSFDSGAYQISPMPVIVEESDTLYTQSLTLHVLSPDVDTTAAVFDIKDPVNTPFTLKEALPYVGIGMGILIIAAMVFLMIMRAKGKTLISGNAPPEIPAHVKAIQRLDKLKKEKIWQKGLIKEYYTELSDTVRIYIFERYGINALESTSDETLHKFQKYAYDDALLMELLENLLQLSDLVKFAKEDPTPSENETNLNNAYIFIEKTRPVEKVNELESEVTQN